MAADRVVHMEFMRRRAYGAISELFGPAFVDDDRLARVLGLLDLSQANAEHYRTQWPEVYAELEAFAAGVNAWRDDMIAGDVPRPSSMDDIDPAWVPEPWTPADSVAVAKLLVLSFSFQPDLELAIFAGEVLMSPASWRELHPFTPLFATHALETEPTSDDVLRMPGADPKRGAPPLLALSEAERVEAAAAISALAQTLTRARGAAEIGILGGSNAWTVGAEHTADGSTILCNDTHMSLQLPSVVYPAHLVDTSVDDIGAIGWIVPGAPGVLIGNTASTAWGITNAFADVADLYVERLTEDGEGVTFAGRTVALDIHDEVIRVRRDGGGLDDVDEIPITIRSVPHHGPIFNDLLPAEVGQTLDGFGLTFSVRWPGLAADTEEFVTFRALLDAQTIDDQVAAMDHFTSGVMNWHFADAAGGHGYMPAGAYPARPWDLQEQPPYAPLPSEGEHEWDGIVPMSDIPRLLRPAKGYTVSANASMNDGALDGAPERTDFYMHHFVDLGTRAHRLTDVLDGLVQRGDITLDEMRTLQIDTHSIYSDVFLPGFLALDTRACAELDALACDAVARLATWDGQQAADSVATTIFNT